MKPYVLGVDLDGVCADYHEWFQDTLSDLTDVPVEDLPPWDDWNYTAARELLDSVGGYKVVHETALDEGLFAQCNPIDGAADALHRIQETGVTLRIITHRVGWAGNKAQVVAETASWLEASDIPYDDLCFIEHKVEVGCDALIDDRPVYIEEFEAAGRAAIVFDQPWNQGVGRLRLMSWREAPDLVDQLCRNRNGWNV